MNWKTKLKGMADTLHLDSLYKPLLNRRRISQSQKTFWDWTGEDQLRHDFYRQLVEPGSTVFDVGANLGNRSKIFARLGAKIVAIEPQKLCASFLEGVFSETPDFFLVERALGEEPGQAEMHISHAHTVSSFSEEWIDAVKKSGRFSGLRWNKTEWVEVVTLDSLISEFGVPDFIKIDVEGFEEKVIRGLTQPVRAISIEFVPELIRNTLGAIEHLQTLGDWEYQVSMEESMQFSLPAWIGEDEIRDYLGKVPSESFGDLYARCRAILGSIS